MAYAPNYYGFQSSLVIPSTTVMPLIRGDSYDGVANPAIDFPITKDLTSGWTGTMTIRHRVTNASLLAKSVTFPNATTVRVSLDAADTAFAALDTEDDFGPHPFDVEATDGASVLTPVSGVADISKDYTEA